MSVDRNARDGRREIESRQHVVGALTRSRARTGRHRIDLRRLELHRRQIPLARTQKHVPADREQPASAVAARQIGMPGPVGPKEGVLNDVIGVALVARERQSEPSTVLESWTEPLSTVPSTSETGFAMPGTFAPVIDPS